MKPGGYFRKHGAIVAVRNTRATGRILFVLRYLCALSQPFVVTTPRIAEHRGNPSRWFRSNFGRSLSFLCSVSCCCHMRFVYDPCALPCLYCCFHVYVRVSCGLIFLDEHKESRFDATIKSLLHEREEGSSQTHAEEDGGILLGGGVSSLRGDATSLSRQQWLTDRLEVQDQQSLDTRLSTAAWGESAEPGTFAAIGTVSSVNPWP